MWSTARAPSVVKTARSQHQCRLCTPVSFSPKTYHRSDFSGTRLGVKRLTTIIARSTDSVLEGGQPTGEGASTTAPPYSEHKWMWRGHKIAYAVRNQRYSRERKHSKLGHLLTQDKRAFPQSAFLWNKTAGCGKPVVLLHGFAASYGHWRKNIPEIARSHKVYAVDLLGFGASDKPDLDYSMYLWQDQIKDFVEEFVGEEQPVVLMGNSLGSLVAVMVGEKLQPSRLRGLALMNCAGGMNNKAVLDDWRAKLAYPILLLVDFLLQQRAVAQRIFDSLRTRDSLKEMLQNVYSNPEEVDEELVEMFYRPLTDPGALDALVTIITADSSTSPRPEPLFDAVQSPVLFVWGDQDKLTPLDAPLGGFFRACAEQRDNVSLHVVPGAGHCLQDDSAEDVHAHLLPWLNSLA